MKIQQSGAAGWSESFAARPVSSDICQCKDGGAKQRQKRRRHGDMMRHGQTLFTVSNTGDVSSLRVSRFQIVDCVVDSLTTNLNVS